MNVNNASLHTVAVKPSQYPTEKLMEIAFVGKSNVGKSSLINTIVNRKALARTSQNPGKTRTINFFNIENELLFVDLPGYGYARISKSESEKWGSMIETYLKDREELSAIIFLIDIRHEVGKNDLQMLEWLRYYGHDIIVVATKSDKLKRSQLSKHIAMLRKGLSLNKEDILIPFSSHNKSGKEELWAVIDEKLKTYNNKI